MSQSFTDIMSQIRGGFALTVAGRKLEELTKAVRETGKKGSITFTISVEPDKVDENVVNVVPKIVAKIPEKGFTPGVFFVDENGKLTREDPRQLEMLKEQEAQGIANISAQQSRLGQIGRGPQS